MFPSTISTFNIVNPTDRLNSPSHSALHNSISSVLTQVQTVIGVEGANSVVGSLEYLIKSPDSNGGGHIQTANKGGTGQTTYSKGDLLVGQSQSVLTKLAVSSVNGYALVVDSSSPVGLSYQPTISNKIKTSITTATISNSNALTVLYSASILGSTLGTNNAIRWTGEIVKFINDATNTLTFVVNYGNGSIVTSDALNYNTGAINAPQIGTLSGLIVAGGATNAQRGIVQFNTSNNRLNSTASSILSHTYSGTSSINSDATQNLVITAQSSFGGSGVVSLVSGLFVVEKIA